MNPNPWYVYAYALALIIAAIGAVMDVRSRKLPNAICLALAFANVLALSLVGDLSLALSGLMHAAVALIVGMLLFRLGWIGGGDAKFYAAAGLGLPMAVALPLLGWTSVGGLVLLIAMVATRSATGKSAISSGWSVPYGMAIFLGFAATLWFWSGPGN